MDQLYFEIDPNEAGWLLRLFMGNAEHETRQFPGGDDGHTKPAWPGSNCARNGLVETAGCSCGIYGR